MSGLCRLCAQVLRRVAFWGRHTVVEQIDTTASLYSRSLYGDHICLLLKQLVSHCSGSSL